MKGFTLQGPEAIQAAHPHKCEFQEEYYGWRCSVCGLFYAFGVAPWDEEPFEFDATEDFA